MFVFVTCVRYKRPNKQANTIKIIVLLIGPIVLVPSRKLVVFWFLVANLCRFAASEFEYVIFLFLFF